MAGSSPRQGPRPARVKANTSAAEGTKLSLGRVEAAGLGTSCGDSQSSSEGRRPRLGGSFGDEASAQEPPRQAGRAGALRGQAASGGAAMQLTSGSPESDCSSVPTPTLPAEVPELEAGLSSGTLPLPPSGPGSQQLAANSFRAMQAEQDQPAWSPGAAGAAAQASLSRTPLGDAGLFSDNAGSRQHAGDQLAANSTAQQLQAETPLPARHAAAASCEPGVTPAAHCVVQLSEGEEEASPVIWGTARRLGSHSRLVCATIAGIAWLQAGQGQGHILHKPSAVRRLGSHSRPVASRVMLLFVLGSLPAYANPVPHRPGTGQWQHALPDMHGQGECLPSECPCGHSSTSREWSSAHLREVCAQPLHSTAAGCSVLPRATAAAAAVAAAGACLAASCARRALPPTTRTPAARRPTPLPSPLAAQPRRLPSFCHMGLCRSLGGVRRCLRRLVSRH